jgi:outer membrane receptor protein involved in Fe transport
MGMNYSHTSGAEDFNFIPQSGVGPEINNGFNGFDLGVFGQATWHPQEWTAVEFGLRYDQHNAPDILSENQISPRIKLNFFPDEFNTLYLYYGRLFIPINIEGLRTLASQLGGSNTGTLSERDNLYEIGFLRKWPFNLSSKITTYYKEASPGLDDQTLGNSAVKTPVNIDVVKITGIELALTYNDPASPLSGYLNAALNHAVNQAPVTGGFLPADSSTRVFDADHDQRLSIVAGLNYQTTDYFLTLTEIYGSGLTNGNQDFVFKTGLFDFNQEAHTTPSWILNMGGGYTIPLSQGHSIEPSLFVTNVLDHAHLLKGAFFSGAAFEERRNVVFKLSYHI